MIVNALNIDTPKGSSNDAHVFSGNAAIGSPVNEGSLVNACVTIRTRVNDIRGIDEAMGMASKLWFFLHPHHQLDFVYYSVLTPKDGMPLIIRERTNIKLKDPRIMF